MSKTNKSHPGLSDLAASLLEDRPNLGVRRHTHQPVWIVQISLGGDKIRRKSFRDDKYGGMRSAHEAASAWRDEQLAKRTAPRAQRVPRQKQRINNTTGVIGVSRRRTNDGPAYVAQTQLRGGPHFLKQFSCNRYGEAEALALAIAERERQLEKADAYRAKHPTPRHSPPQGRPHSPDMYGISRVGSTRKPQWGWQVNLSRKGESVVDRYFGDATYDGCDAALKAAQAYRDEMIRQHPPITKREYAQRVRKNNTTGVAGVSRRESDGFPRYIACTTLPSGRRIEMSFSITQYGEEGAFELAVKERQRQLEHVEGYLVHSPSALPDSDK